MFQKNGLARDFLTHILFCRLWKQRMCMYLTINYTAFSLNSGLIEISGKILLFLWWTLWYKINPFIVINALFFLPFSVFFKSEFSLYADISVNASLKRKPLFPHILDLLFCIFLQFLFDLPQNLIMKFDWISLPLYIAPATSWSVTYHLTV